jgi:hypothetical protein
VQQNKQTILHRLRSKSDRSELMTTLNSSDVESVNAFDTPLAHRDVAVSGQEVTAAELSVRLDNYYL